MKLRELLELQARPETNNVITIHEGKNYYQFVSEADYKNFDLDKFGDAEVVYFTAEAVDRFSGPLPFLSITCYLEEQPPKQNMQETVEEFFDYLDECHNGAGFKMMF